MGSYTKLADIEPIISVLAQGPSRLFAIRADAAEFLQSTVTIDPGGRVSFPDLYGAYMNWCLARGLRGESRRIFGAYIQAPRVKSNGIMWIMGICVPVEAMPSS